MYWLVEQGITGKTGVLVIIAISLRLLLESFKYKNFKEMMLVNTIFYNLVSTLCNITEGFIGGTLLSNTLYFPFFKIYLNIPKYFQYLQIYDLPTFQVSHHYLKE